MITGNIDDISGRGLEISWEEDRGDELTREPGRTERDVRAKRKGGVVNRKKE